MLFTQSVLEGIARGDISVAFRRWARPRVKAGGRLRTSAGVLQFDAVNEINSDEITDRDAERAGAPSRSEIVAFLDGGRGDKVYRIDFHLAGPDPRIELRSRADLTEKEVEGLLRRLARLDKASRTGPWTTATLQAIECSPATRAGILAATLRRERLSFKRDVRKLKDLGLTESLEIGYRLSARGLSLMQRLGLANDA